MRAVWLKEFGGPEVLVAAEAPDPVAGPGQALIEVAFANITFVEIQFRASGTGPYQAELPMILGNGVGGVVTSVGAGVDEGLLGAGDQRHWWFGRLCRARRGGRGWGVRGS